MLTAITRAPSPSLAACELSFLEREPIDLAKARAQHQAYEQLLADLGARLLRLPAEPDLPDSMFVEDPALVLDELAVIFPLGARSRRAEAPSLAAALRPFRELHYVKLPGTVEGGDIVRIGRQLFVGQTARSNADGIAQLARITAPYGYRVAAVPVTGCLHLKSALTALDARTLLANRAWFDTSLFPDYQWVDVDPGEPHAGNALTVAGAVIFPSAFPRTRERILARGFRLTALDISELQKAEAALTCSSLIFDAP
jgi:dimethylargininase